MKKRHVYLGRFAPFHLGHSYILSKMIEINGIDSVLVLVGSSNALNKRTPFTFEDRKKIVQISFPGVEILPLPDGKPGLEYFDGSTNDLWLDNLQRLAKERDEEFVFYGGSKEDLEVLAERFETVILVDRFTAGKGINATAIRDLVISKNKVALANFVDIKAVDYILEKYTKL